MYDSAIFAAYEFCYFLDHTGNPLAYSASLLRDARSNVVNRGALISTVWRRRKSSARLTHSADAGIDSICQPNIGVAFGRSALPGRSLIGKSGSMSRRVAWQGEVRGLRESNRKRSLI